MLTLSARHRDQHKPFTKDVYQQKTSTAHARDAYGLITDLEEAMKRRSPLPLCERLKWAIPEWCRDGLWRR